ncbi:GATA zinc finger domain-containing protein 10-like isoform X2 [Ornithodoros turicata]|uniref:GATA zinc finger domain-containing protein 10-like isoform X2 n=1 Tax=Ornithodoros turicata TaxID=34597 RepID=UPI003138BA6F
MPSSVNKPIGTLLVVLLLCQIAESQKHNPHNVRHKVGQRHYHKQEPYQQREQEWQHHGRYNQQGQQYRHPQQQQQQVPAEQLSDPFHVPEIPYEVPKQVPRHVTRHVPRQQEHHVQWQGYR